MEFDSAIRNWQSAIIADAEGKLQRSLKSCEKEFITSRAGFIALEMIHDTVRASGATELQSYLSSDWHQDE